MKKVMEIPGDWGRGISEAPWNRAESWEAGVMLIFARLNDHF